MQVTDLRTWQRSFRIVRRSHDEPTLSLVPEVVPLLKAQAGGRKVQRLRLIIHVHPGQFDLPQNPPQR